MNIVDFIRESNKIEGILREPRLAEVQAAETFLELPEVHIGDLTAFVHACEPTAMLRVQSGMDVRVGTHLPPSGGVGISCRLEHIIANINEGVGTPWENHVEYETLHPFTDCNGRSGRILWAWQMHNEGQDFKLNLGFLHAFYYQTLEQSRID